ncbi:MAG: hypothetical protein A2020_14450 [Lentisphaerae bacterium GWF2_45_14]|nr:MAG: hypothetical protein A2020_14450 [Lentisphaerae bacterium GWF2_45_14]
MFDLLRKIWYLLIGTEKAKMVLIVVMMAIGAFMEILGIGFIMPVVALVSKPDLIEQNKYLKMISDIVQPSSHGSLIITLCVIIIVLYVGKNLFLLFLAYVQSSFIFNKSAKLSDRLFENYIHTPYSFHLKHNSSHLIGNIELIVSISNGVLMPTMILMTELSVIAVIMVTLLFLSPVTTLVLTGITVLISIGMYYPLRSLNFQTGREMQVHRIKCLQYMMEGLGAVKECKVRNGEDFFCAEHSKQQQMCNHSMMMQYFLGQIPRFSIEALVVILGMGTLAVFVHSGMSMGSVLLTLTLLAVSMIRLMPSMSRIQYNLARIRQTVFSFDEIFIDLTQIEHEKKNPAGESIILKDKISLEKITFAYDGTKRNIFNKYSLEIPCKASVAIVGLTGCGKTTLVDIILGLLKPDSGTVMVDGRDIEENLQSWQNSIGYVPQTIYLTDNTVRANVAFAVRDDLIDDERVRECLKTAQILDFIDSLPDGINSHIGEKGVRISGGQRQRIGIARALYHSPKVLVLDEATAALDNETEKAFVDAIKTLHGKLTIIMIAHRLTTTENCDTIINFSTDHGLTNNIGAA